MKTVLDTLFLRRPKLNYVSPPVCPVVVSASSHSVSTEELFPVASPSGESFCGTASKWIRLTSVDQAICHSLYKATGDVFTNVYDCIRPRSVAISRAGCYRIGAIINGIESLGGIVCNPATLELPSAEFYNLYYSATVDGTFAIEVPTFSSDIFELPSDGVYRLSSITLDGESALSADITSPTCGGDEHHDVEPNPPDIQTPCPTYLNFAADQNMCPASVDRNGTMLAQDSDGFSIAFGIGFMAPGFWGSEINQADADDIAIAVLAKKVQENIGLVDCSAAPCLSPISVETVGNWPATVQQSYCPRFEIGCERIGGCLCPDGVIPAGCPCCGGTFGDPACPCCASGGPCQPGCYDPKSEFPVDLCPSIVTALTPMQNGGPGVYKLQSQTDVTTHIFCADGEPCAVCEEPCGNAFSRIFLGPITLCNNGAPYRLTLTVNAIGTLCRNNGCTTFSSLIARANANGPSGHLVEVNSGIVDAVWQSSPCSGSFDVPINHTATFAFDLPTGANTVFIRLYTNEATATWTVSASSGPIPP